MSSSLQMSSSLLFRQPAEAQIPEVDSSLLIQGCKTMHAEEHTQPEPKAGYNFLSNLLLTKAALFSAQEALSFFQTTGKNN